jgi:hypothetical protein
LKKYAETGTEVKIGRTGLKPATRDPPNDLCILKKMLKKSPNYLSSWIAKFCFGYNLNLH